MPAATIDQFTARDARRLFKNTTGLFRSRNARTFQPVHRRSYHAGEEELRRWRECNTFNKSEHNARMRAAEEFERGTKLPGKRNGALGHIALDLLRVLLRLRGRKGGRLDPSIEWLAGILRRSPSAIKEALARLREHCFIDWIRRTRPVPDPTPGGQYVEQITNAYFLLQPASVAEHVRRMLRRPNEAIRRMAQETIRLKRLATSTIDELIAEITYPALRTAAASLAAGVAAADDDVEGAKPPSGLN